MVENIENEAIPPKDVEISETTENYLKRIYILIETYGKARISDIAELMGRSLSSVSEAVQRMKDEGLLHYERYGKITLTEDGKKVAEGVYENYSIINDLLRTLGIPEKIAMEDACSMEHQISPKTSETLKKFIDFVQSDEETKTLFQRFQQSLEN